MRITRKPAAHRKSQSALGGLAHYVTSATKGIKFNLFMYAFSSPFGCRFMSPRLMGFPPRHSHMTTVPGVGTRLSYQLH